MNRAERLGALRAELARMGVQGFLIPRADSIWANMCRVPPKGWPG
jgi:hypothetical protein